ncbi:MAG: molybdopterin-dependent oxidoreductase [Dehalococcoidales bacterium]|nr:molybdopterin-dependent oxidoreductase [Dehalococcoidales bacterium]
MKKRLFFLLITVAVMLLMTACRGVEQSVVTGISPSVTAGESSALSPHAETEIEATEYLGQKLTPLDKQRTVALKGMQVIDRDSYRLTVDGLVDRPLSLSYADLLAYPQASRLNELECVEGWNFIAKWSGPELMSIFDDAGIKPEARIAIFYTSDVPEGYSSLDLDYIREKNIIIALKINDLTLPSERGFPFQVVAESKYGYKWAKWVVHIELSSNTDFRGYWESAGYSNKADAGGPAFGD